MKNFYLLVSLCFCLSLSYNCSHDDIQAYEENAKYREAGAYLKNNFDFTLFYAAIEKTGLLEEINTKKGITIFAPNNKAFNAQGIYHVSDFDNLNVDSLRIMLNYCILDQVIISNTIPAGSIDDRYHTVAGLDVFISKFDNGWTKTSYVNGVTITYPDQIVANGVVHTIENVLKYTDGTVQDILTARNEYTYFVAALKKFGYWDQLANPGSWMLLAPNNDQFEKNGITLSDIEAMNPAHYKKRLFGCYVFKSQIFTTDMGVVSTGGTQSFTVPIEGDETCTSGINAGYGSGAVGFYRESNSVWSSISIKPLYKVNYLSSNGIVHNLDGLFALPSNALISTIQQ